RPGPLARLALWARRRPTLATSLVLLLVVAALASTTVAVLLGRERIKTDTQRQVALKNLGLADQRADALGWELYVSRVNLAYGEWVNNNVALASRLLEECPESRRDWEWRLCWRLCHFERLTLRNHRGRITGVAISPDGAYVATCARALNGIASELNVWDAKTGREITALRTSPADPNFNAAGVAYSHDSSLLASYDSFGNVQFRTPTGERLVRSFSSPSFIYRSMLLSPDFRKLVATYDRWGPQTPVGDGAPGVFRVWDVASEQPRDVPK
ncbi:WD40 repeat domain-containing protein, partial [Singulisphaera rosea]